MFYLLIYFLNRLLGLRLNPLHYTLLEIIKSDILQGCIARLIGTQQRLVVLFFKEVIYRLTYLGKLCEIEQRDIAAAATDKQPRYADIKAEAD